VKTIEGIQVLLVTPMLTDGALDYDSTRHLIEHVIRGGVQGITLLGSTGEFFSLSEHERKEFTERSIEMISGRVAVGVCVGAPGTDAAIDFARHAEASGADYVLLPIPFYFSNTLLGIVDFYTRVARSVSISIMPYDGGGGNSIDMEAWRRIVLENPNINLAKVTIPLPPKVKWLHEEFSGRVRALGGSDQTILLCLANGAVGLSVAGANVVPEMFGRMFELYRQGDREGARNVYYEKISPMNVIAVPAHTEFIQCYKQALYWMGIIASPYTRGPMMLLDEPRKEELLGALIKMGLPVARERCLDVNQFASRFEAQ
jgi:dihydrodipicolinate synthase/N-acetylneuraminate lyase